MFLLIMICAKVFINISLDIVLSLSSMKNWCTIVGIISYDIYINWLHLLFFILAYDPKILSLCAFVFSTQCR